MRIMFDEVRSNKLKSWVLMFFFIILIGILGALIGAVYDSLLIGLSLAVAFGLIYSMMGMYSGDRMILKMSDARSVTKHEFPYLFHTIEGLAISAGIPCPKAYVIDDSALNAFATGRDLEHASITVTTGLLKTMNRQELEGVVAHEMSHIKNYDIRFMMLVTVMIGIVTLLSDFLLRSFLWGSGRHRRSSGGSVGIVLIAVGLLLAVLSPLIGKMIQLAISRKREFMADANAAVLTRYPPGL
ncbi:MAG: M48 family metallopeptidase, partial [archaeon]|nr:M48 family metallopeptidase [archaeon]